MPQVTGRRYLTIPPATQRHLLTSAQRVSWLLRANRLLGPEPRYRTLTGFAGAMGGINASTLSRWETGRLPAPYSAVRRYEAILELPTGLLTSAIDTTHRFWARYLDYLPVLRRNIEPTDPQAHVRLDRLLDQACSTSTMSGNDWDHLTALLSGMPRVFLSGRSWTELTSRLLLELNISDGVPWFQRFESFNRLLSHPTGQQAAVAACTASAADQSNQIVVESVCILDCSAHASASRAVVSQIKHPTSERAQQGALMACVRKFQYHHFSDGQARCIMNVAGDLIGDSTCAETKALAAELIYSQRTASSHLVTNRLRRAMAHGRGSYPHTNSSEGAIRAQVAVNRIINTATSWLPCELPNFDDGVIGRLVEEMLFGETFDTRLYAGTLIGATPYRRPLAAAIGLELATPRTFHDADLMAALITALRFLGGPSERQLVERLVLTGGTPSWIRKMAAYALGHLDGTTSVSFWSAALQHYGRHWAKYRTRESASILDGLVYGLGMARAKAALVAVRDDYAAPAPTRAAATWWLNIPSHLWHSRQ